MPDEQQHGILGDLKPTGAGTSKPIKESDDARAIREFRELQNSFGARVVLPQRWHFH